MLCHVLAEEGTRTWLAFRRPVASLNGSRFTNHYVVCSENQAILIDPGGAADFGPLLAAIADNIALDTIAGIVVTQRSSHSSGSIGMWAEALGYGLPIYASEMIASDLLHTDADLKVEVISENGGEVPMADGSGLHMMPSPYLPTAASMSLYDPTARVLYTSDIGTAEGAWADDATPFCEQFSLISHAMNAYHQAWLPSAAARDDWLARVDELAVEIVAPRAGPCFRGKDISHFKRWLASMDIGVLVDNHAPAYLSENTYAPEHGRDDTDIVMAPPPLEEHDDVPFMDETEQAAHATLDNDNDDDDEYVDIDDDEVSRLVDALGVDDADVEEVPADYDLLDDDDEFDIVYVDEDGNEIDPSEIEDDELIEEEDELVGNDEQRLEFPPGQMFRLITRSDFDGLVCAVLLEELDLINDILFVHPNQMQEGEIDVSETDISTNLPYTPGVFAAFDHHLSEIKRLGKHYDNHIIDPLAPSAARVVYNYFGAEKRFPNISTAMMDAVDKGDAAQFSQEEVIDAEGWPLLNFIMDSRTGLGRYRGFRVPNYELMMSLIDYCRRYDIDQILEHPDVKERVDLYREHEGPAKEQIKRCTTVHGNLAVIDYRNEDSIYVVNRFMIYALFPECNISMHVLWGRGEQNTVFAVGKSIFNRTSNTNIGDLMLTYGGGGHRNAGTCQSDNALADIVRDALIQRINEDG
jgi:nanoRNase/pAp phosphatase (c-di-AMP/oligoRNAs hydrolase)/glyoxylase-like metal-dependent hydrolase (beta-lactamase superfamily II)